MSNGCVRSADNICSAPLVCEICETCAEHCTVGQPGDLAAHCAFDEVIARRDDPPAELAEVRAKADRAATRG